MENEERKWDEVKEEEEVEEEEEETALQERKSRSVNNSKSTEIAVIGTDDSNGTSDSDGHEFQSEVTANGADNHESTLENEQNTEELDGFIENEDEVKNGLQKSDNLVFFDKDEGIWKCRICSWIYRNGSDHVDHIQNHRQQLHKLMNGKTLSSEYEGVDLTSTYTGEQHIEKINGHHKLDISSQEYVPHNSTYTINNKSEGGLEDDSLSYENLQHSQISFQKQSASYKSSKEIESAEIDLIHEDELEVTELDVERVLENQTTHDLFCPNCNSCITRRVILSKRKRRIRISEEDIKRNKIEATADLKSDFGSFLATSDQIHHKDDVEVGGTPVLTTNNVDRDKEVGGTPILTTDTVDRDEEPDVFRCLSCFSFFIPTGSGFKLFRMFGEKNVKATVRDEQVPSIKKNWFASMFASNKQETTVERGSSSRADGVKSDVGLMPSNMVDQNGGPSFIQVSRSPDHSSEGLVGTAGKNGPLNGGDKILPFPSQGLNGKVLNGSVEDKTTDKRDSAMEHSEAYGTDTLKESKSGREVSINHGSDLSAKMFSNKTHFTNGESVEDAISFSQEGGLKLLISSNEGFLNVEKPEESRIPSQKVQISTGGETIQLLTTPVSVIKDVDGRVDISLAVPHEEQHVEAILLTESIIENKNANLWGSDDGHVYPTEVSQHIVTKTKFEVHTGESLKIDNIPSVKGATIIQGKDTVITIDARPVGSSQTGQVIITPAETASALHSATQVIVDHDRTEVRNDFEIEVIKSIVYGGLAESITSLSVVSSAAGGDAATLNILALGMANLIGGLFIICHNLWELRSDCVVQVSSQIRPVTQQRDRYKELLGRRENFTLHAIVSILSYIIFGLVPPIAYGFSFRKSDNKEFKLLVVAAASLLCIITLAIGRAHVRRPPKPYVKSVITFVILGFMASGVSYVAGVLVERILEELGLFKSSSVTNLLLPQTTTPSYSGWAAG